MFISHVVFKTGTVRSRIELEYELPYNNAEGHAELDNSRILCFVDRASRHMRVMKST
jgi:hypothetical protein